MHRGVNLVNYQAKNKTTGDTCGHFHHSDKSASACAEHLGWTGDFRVITVNRDDYDRERYPRRTAFEVSRAMDINEFFVTVNMTVKADSEQDAAELVGKWLDGHSAAKRYVGHSIESVRRAGI